MSADTTFTYEELIEQLVGIGVERPKAEARARTEYPDAAAARDVATIARAHALEKDEQRAIRKMAIAIGFKVYWLSQAEKSGQTPGLGDLWMAHAARGVALWWETKRRSGGTRSSVQVDFGAECIACHIGYGYGDRVAFARWLNDHGFTAPPIPQD